jgi:thioredoxin 1
MRVKCLCANWCGTCRDFMPIFAALKAELRLLDGGSQMGQPEFEWLELEECEALLGETEVQTFPMLLIGDGPDTIHFAGPVTPHLATLVRLVRAAARGELRVPESEAQPWLTFLRRLDEKP